MMAPSLWWRVLVGGELGGADGVSGVVVVRVGINPCRHLSSPAWRRLRAPPSFLKGVGSTLPPLPSVYREKSQDQSGQQRRCRRIHS